MQWPFDTKSRSLKLRHQRTLLIRIDFYFIVVWLMYEKRSSIWAKKPRVIHLWAIISAQSRDLAEQLFVLIKIYTQLKVSNQFPLKSKGSFFTKFDGCWLSLQRGCSFSYESFPRSLCLSWGKLLVQTGGGPWDKTLPERFMRKEICRKELLY